MTHYDIPISSLTDEQRLYYDNLEAAVKNKIRQVLADGGYKQLSVQTSINIVAWNGATFDVDHNAAASMPGSYPVAAGVQELLSGEKFNTLTKKATFIVKLNFVPTPKESPKTTEAQKEDAAQQFHPQKPRYTFEQIILPETVREEIMSALDVIKSQDLIYNQWGFSEVDSVPRSILNFYGPPGTGKTMCAHAIADHLGKPLLALNYSEIESKYVGEAAKNLVNAFNQAREQDAVLFFDEADSFLGRRIENVTQGADQALNSLRSQMLILLEEFSGVVVFATNLVTNFDAAFESRILKHIKFELPNREARACIIRKMLPSKLPIEAEWTEEQMLLASDEIDGLSGREIKGAILEMLLTKANKYGEKAIFSFSDLLDTMKAKKASIEKLKAEESERRKLKIMKKLTEKAEEAQMEENVKKEREEQNVANDNIQTSTIEKKQ